MKLTLNRLILFAVALAGGGILIVWSGIVPIPASSGHWPITKWFLHYAMRQSVKTHSLGIKAPPLEKLRDPALVQRGAGHFASGCASCHGAPGEPRTPIVLAMAPHPPYLSPRIDKWQPEELFWIVKHGVKYTGMPAWVNQQRDDEVWSVVAFLLSLPMLEPTKYQQLAYGEMVSGAPWKGGARLSQLNGPFDRVLDNCARCHGHDGMGRGVGAFPQLTQINHVYLFTSLKSYAAGKRPSGIMQPIAAALDEDMMLALAKHYASQPLPGDSVQTSNRNSDVLARGEKIAKYGLPEQGVPACLHCHGPDAVAQNPLFPALAGQYENYLVAQLELWVEGNRGGSSYARVMETVVRNLQPEQIRAVAAYFAALNPAQRVLQERQRQFAELDNWP